MRTLLTLLAALWLSLSAGASSPRTTAHPQGVLEPFREALIRLESRDMQGCYVLDQDDVKHIAAAIGRAIHLPPSWRIVLRHDTAEGVRKDALSTRFDTRSEMLWTTLVDSAQRPLPLRLTLDAQWVMVGSTAFIGPDGATEFTRAQFQTRTGFFPLRSIPIVLARLHGELESLDLGRSSVKYIGLDSVQPLGPSPYVRCALGLEDTSTAAPATMHLNGVMELPATAAHGGGFQFAGCQGFADSVVGTVTATKTLAECLRESRAVRDAILPADVWSTTVFDNNGTSSFPTYVKAVRNERSEYSDFRIDSTGFPDATGELSASIAGVPLTSAGLRQVTETLARSYDPDQLDLFLVIGSGEHREIEFIFTSALEPPPARSGMTSLRLVLDAGGTKLESVERVIVLEITRASKGRHTHWTCRFADGRLAEVSIRKREICGVGVDFTSRCTIGESSYEVAGGIAETTLRGD